jgi:hypothetical protein
MRRCAPLLALLLAAPAGADVLARSVEATSCGALIASGTHEVARARIAGEEAQVDLDARAWRLDEPALYRRAGREWVSEGRHRVGEGAVRVRIALAPEAGRFAAELLPEPGGDFAVALAQYLPGQALPCRATGRIAATPGPGSGRSPESAAAVHALLRRATEQLYDQRFAAAQAALAEAERLAPGSDTVRWMRARAAYLEGEALPADARARRLAAF